MRFKRKDRVQKPIFRRVNLKFPENGKMSVGLGDGPGLLNVWDGTNHRMAARNVERGNILATWKSYRKRIEKERQNGTH